MVLLPVLSFFFATTTGGSALKCYKDRLDGSLSPAAEECEAKDISYYVLESTASFFGDNTTEDASVEMSCFTIHTETDEFREDQRGCTLKGACKLLEGDRQAGFAMHGTSLEKFQAGCTECDKDGCNSPKLLKCYTTNITRIGQFETDDDLNATIQDCREYLNGTKFDFNRHSNGEFGCFTLTAEGSTTEHKGCVPKGGCKELEAYLELKLAWSTQKWKNPKCAYCDRNECNFGSKATVSRMFLLLLLLTVTLH